MPMVHPHSILLATVNGIGLIIELLYAFFFIFYSDSKKKRLRVMVLIFAEFLFIAILALLVLNLASTTKQRSAIVGSICTAGNIMMYASPLAIMVSLSLSLSLLLIFLIYLVISLGDGSDF